MVDGGSEFGFAVGGPGRLGGVGDFARDDGVVGLAVEQFEEVIEPFAVEAGLAEESEQLAVEHGGLFGAVELLEARADALDGEGDGGIGGGVGRFGRRRVG